MSEAKPLLKKEYYYFWRPESINFYVKVYRATSGNLLVDEWYSMTRSAEKLPYIGIQSETTGDPGRIYDLIFTIDSIFSFNVFVWMDTASAAGDKINIVSWNIVETSCCRSYKGVCILTDLYNAIRTGLRHSCYNINEHLIFWKFWNKCLYLSYPPFQAELYRNVYFCH